MARSCSLTGKRLEFGHNVSHSNRKTHRTFLPNIQSVSLESQALRRTLRLDISTRALRTLQKKGGLDRFLIETADEQLTEEARRLKRRVRRALSTPRRQSAD